MKKKVIWTLSILIAFSASLSLLVYSKKGRAQSSAFVLGTNAGSYLVGEYVTYKIFDAPPNSPIYWTSFHNGQPTLEVDSYYGQVTDDQGNWEGEVGPWTSAQYGNWRKQAKVEGIVSTTGFSVIEGDTWSCKGPVSECLRIAKEKGSTRVWVAPRLSDGYGMTTDFDAVKDSLLVVRTRGVNAHYPVYDTELDRIVTYSKFRIDILRQPPHPCTQCSSPITLPPGVSAGDGEMLVLVDGGEVTIDGVFLFTEYDERFWGYPRRFNEERVLVLNQNEHNPRLAGLATGHSSVYSVRNYPSFGGEGIIGNPFAGIHPLIALNDVPYDPSSAFFVTIPTLINRLNN